MTHAALSFTRNADRDCSPNFTVAASVQEIKWCIKSSAENMKCRRLATVAPAISCVSRQSTLECIVAIKVRNTLKGVM